MFDFHEKRKIRRVIYSKFFIFGIFVVTTFIMMSAYERYTIEREMALKLNDRMEELKTLETRAVSLESRVEHLRNERGIEEELRNRFDVIKEGEQVVIIIDEESSDVRQNNASKTPTQPIVKESFFERLKFWQQ